MLNNKTTSINVTTTGNLDCVAFANQIVNSTHYVHNGSSYADEMDAVVCNSKTASVTTRRLYPTKESRGGKSYTVSVKLLVMTFIVGFGCML